MIRLENIHKSYRNIPAVNGISLDIKKGEFYSLLGPNGAGKTTTINMISTLFPPDNGSVFINNSNAASHPAEVKKMIGVVPQEISLYEELSAYDNLLFFGSLYSIRQKELKIKADSLLADFGLTDRKKDRISTFSGGMKRRINIAAALMHEPQVLVMDEPTVGVDPQSRNNIYEAIKRIHEQGITILYTTHYLEEAEKFSDRIGIIDHGKIIAEGTLPQLLAHSNETSEIKITISDRGNEQLRVLENKWNFLSQDSQLTLSTSEMKKDLPALLSDLLNAGMEILDMDIRSAGLESVFLSLTGKNLRD